MAFTPGYYQTNYRALRFRELVRFRGWRRALTGWLATRFKRPTAAAWMPSLWADTECRREDLSEQFWQTAKMHRANFERLGYVECGFLKSSKNLNPNVRDSGGIRYLDPTRRFFGQLTYQRHRSPATGADIHQITIAFTAAFPHGSLSCTNNRLVFDRLPENEVVRVKSYDVNFIHQEFQKHLQERKEAPLEFPDLESLRRRYDARQIATFEEHARRRLFVPMTEQEIAAAKVRKEQADAGIFPKPRRRLRLGWWPVIILVLIGLQATRMRPHSGRIRESIDVHDDTIEYHGQNFKMRRHYATYEDYKDDQDNLDTNDLDRLEQAMTSVKVPPTFKDWRAFSHTLFFDLRFPGYGAGGIAMWTDDGSTIETGFVEIPQRNEDRYLVARDNSEGRGQLTLVDDFISGTATNEIQQVKLEKQVLRYYDGQNHLIREKHL